MAYQYPGNVRQLEHIIQRAVAIAQRGRSSSSTISRRNCWSPPRPSTAGSEGTVAAARERAEREMIVATLARHDGEIAAAARELQVSRTTMWRLMKKHGIDRLERSRNSRAAHDCFNAETVARFTGWNARRVRAGRQPAPCLTFRSTHLVHLAVRAHVGGYGPSVLRLRQAVRARAADRIETMP